MMTKLTGNFLRAGVLLLACTFALTFSSCAAGRKGRVKAPADFYLYLERTPCFGTCPIFKMTVDAKGNVEYRGARFVEKTGVWQKTLTDAQFSALVQLMRNSEIREYQALYDEPGVTDLPSTILEYRADKGVTKTTCRIKCPASFIDLIKKIELTIGEDGYTQVEKPAEE